MMKSVKPIISCIEPLGFPFKTLDPFLFCVYHWDNYPAGDELMQAPRRGNGADFDWSQPYRMYHGDRIPGFPQHPHRGFETVTATLEGLIDHSDSCRNAGRYGEGDLQWMTAGKGVVHGEMFPLINKNKPNTCRLFQIWMNLPASKKMVDPSFVMFWHEKIPKIENLENKSRVTLWAGNYEGRSGLTPPPDSWASDKDNHVAILLIELGPQGFVSIPSVSMMMDSMRANGAGDDKVGENGCIKPSKYSLLKVKEIINEVDKRRLNRSGLSEKQDLIQLLEDFDQKNMYTNINRVAYFVEGKELLINDSNRVPTKSSVTLDSSQEVVFRNPSSDSSVEILILQGRPIGEPVAQQGPFVMNSDAEIKQAFADYRRTQFGGWPWPDDAMVFPRDKGRFALIGGKEEQPSSDL